MSAHYRVDADGTWWETLDGVTWSRVDAGTWLELDDAREFCAKHQGERWRGRGCGLPGSPLLGEHEGKLVGYHRFTDDECGLVVEEAGGRKYVIRPDTASRAGDVVKKCECGAAACGSPRHSAWCPLY